MSIKCPKCNADNPDTKQFCSDCGTQLTPSEDAKPSFTKTLETPVSELARGTLFAGRYEIIEELGAGGMGKVYRVEDKKAHEEIALKLIRPEVAADKKTIDRFRNELITARKVRHKNVCGMYDLGEHEGTRYITMEYVSGEDLKSLVRRVTFATGTAIKIAKQVCEGLAEAHRLGVVHRDLKPSNIMIDREGSARIMDFGIARSLSAKGLTGEGIIIGTPEYMSPEQAEAKEVDHRSDIYSLGVILYEIVTGQLPFTGETPLSIAMKHKGETPKEPKTLNPQIPDDLDRLILKCLGKDKQARYESAGQLLSDLTNIEKTIPTTQKKVVQKKTITSREITVTFSAKKMLIPAIMIAAISLIGLFLWHPWSKKAVPPISSDRPSVAILYFENNTGNQELEHLRDVILNVLITDLNQSKYLSVVSQDQIFSVLENLNLVDEDKYSFEDLEAISQGCGVSNTVTGSYYTSGEKFIFNTSFKNLQKEETVTFSEEGEAETAVPDIIDRISLRIKSELGLSQEQIASDTDEKAGLIRSYSPDALKYFSQGDKFYKSALYDKAIPLLEAAIEADPNMAIAYAHLGSIYWNRTRLKDNPDVRDNLEKALSLSDGASQRERLLIQGTYYLLIEGGEIGRQILEELVEKYPDEYLGYRRLGVFFATLGNRKMALEYQEKAFQIRPDSYQEVFNLTASLNLLREYEKTEKILNEFLQKFPEHVRTRRRLIAVYENQGKYDLALSESDRLFQIAPDAYIYPLIRAWIYMRKGDLLNAEIEIQKTIDSDIPQNKYEGTEDLAFLRLFQGRKKESLDLLRQTVEWRLRTGGDSRIFPKRIYLINFYLANDEPLSALHECEKALHIANEMNDRRYVGQLIYRKGNCMATMNRVAEAKASAEELRQLSDTEKLEILKRLTLMLKGKIESAMGNYPKAIEYLKDAVKMRELNPSGSDISANEYLYSLAEVYYQSGNLEKAKVEFEKIDKIGFDWGYRLDIIGLSIYMLGKINEQQGDKAKAIEHYEKFLELWKDADPGLPEVTDARNRLAKIRTTQ